MDHQSKDPSNKVFQGAVQRVPLSAREEWLDIKEQVSQAYGSGMLPKAIDTPQKAMTIALMGRELGLRPMAALTGLYVVNGMAALRGSLMLRLIYERCPGAHLEVITPPEKAHLECEVEMGRPNKKPQKFRFTLEDAEKAGFMQKPIWRQHTSTMLRWAAIRTGARIVFADAIAGCYMEDEIPERDVSPSKAVLQGSDRDPGEVTVEPPKALTGSTQTPEVSEGEALAAEVVDSTTPLTGDDITRMFERGKERHWKQSQLMGFIKQKFQKMPSQLNRHEFNVVISTIDQGGPERLQ